MKTFHYIVEGRVQGVGYRFYVGYRLNKLKLKGKIKNLDSGDVEVLLQGSEEEIIIAERYLKMGSPLSKVENIIKDIIEKEEFFKFDIEY